ncbi:uncharacterized protein LOC135332138 [Halichondria panicea]|uniref:uncharacterized protein LOC135332138 n=1 Tax=Halichondria panicea TaxID=6063 RepID=UPI00312B8281
MRSDMMPVPRAVLVVVLSLLSVGYCHYEVNPLRSFRHERAIVKLEQDIKLYVSPNTLNKSGEWVTVSWSSVSQPSTLDWVGLWVLPDNQTSIDAKTKAPVKYQYCNHSSTHLSKGFGKLRIYLVNMRGVNQFGFFRGGFENPTLAAVSNVVTLEYPNEPLHGHLALTNNIAEMVLMWVTRDATTPQVKWGTTSKQYTSTKNAVSSTYKATDMCASPARDYGWLDPGLIHKVTLDGLKPQTKYFYIFGDDAYGWSEEFNFTSAPKTGPDVVTRVLAFGDMGHGLKDDTRQVLKLEQPSLNTTKNLISEMGAHDLIIDVGDISYADGYEPIWDEYFDQVKTLLAGLPCMVNPGNHESDSPNSDAYWQENGSGGECNVPYVNRFAMPTPGPQQPWYGFDFGCIHVVMMSTEHDFTSTSKQYTYLSEHLKSVDRTKTPWLIFGGHRPMYVDSSNETEPSGQIPVSKLLIQHIEPLLVTYKVDIAFWGHHHTYQRMCPVVNGVCQEGAPVHVIMGMAGRALLHDLSPTPPSFVKVLDEWHWGYTRFVANSTTLVFQYIHNDGNIYDTVILKKN